MVIFVTFAKKVYPKSSLHHSQNALRIKITSIFRAEAFTFKQFTSSNISIYVYITQHSSADDSLYNEIVHYTLQLTISLSIHPNSLITHHRIYIMCQCGQCMKLLSCRSVHEFTSKCTYRNQAGLKESKKHALRRFISHM